METEGIIPFSVTSMVEDVLKQHGKRLSDIDLASRKAEEASLRRYEAAGWLRKTVGVVGGKDLPAEPSEEEFRQGLRSGIILCNVLNKVQAGAVPKVVEAPSDSVIISDGAALCAFQYFENVRNFLVAVEEMGLPAFEVSDLEQGGKSSRIVNCVLALKSYGDWKQGGGNGMRKFGGGSLKSSSSGKIFVRKNSEPFMNSFSRISSAGDKCVDGLSNEQFLNGDSGNDFSEMAISRSLNLLVRDLLLDKKQEDIPIIVENMLGKVMEEFECRLASQIAQMKPTLQGTDYGERTVEDKAKPERENDIQNDTGDMGSEGSVSKQLVEQQRRYIQDLKRSVHSTRADIQFLQLKYHEEINDLGKHLRGIAHAASGYQKVLEENRKLYNQVQDLKGNIRVYCRVRPFLPGQTSRFGIVDHVGETEMTIITPSKYGKEGRKSFTFNKVFGPSVTQEEVFSDTQPLIRSVLDGFNVCIFAYGQTGSGKTYTMSGANEMTEETLGVNYRALRDLFLISEQRKNTVAYEVSVQMIEIYNEQVRDLLASSENLSKRLEIRNSSHNGINVPDANLVPVSSTSDVIYLMNLGFRNRAVGATAMNDRSSRSHSCLMVHVQGRDLTSGTTLRGCMHLVDLAGSERVDKSEAVGDRLKEAQHINKSLSALGDVISSLAHKNSHVPYRNSKLTQLLQDSLGGQAKTLMFVHISPESDSLGETISTLKFAERVSAVELGAARANRDSVETKELREQVASLKAALARKEGGGETRSLQNSKPGSPEGRGAMSSASSAAPSLDNWQVVPTPGNCRQPMDDGCNIETRNKSASKLRRRSLDPQELSANSPPWPPVGVKDDEKESCSDDWVDKIMVNKKDGVPWEEDNGQLPRMLYQKIVPDSAQIFPGQPLNRSLFRQDVQGYDVSGIRYEMAASTDDSDDQDAATSDSSEPDFLWQYNGPKAISNIPNGLGSKLRKPSPKQGRSPEIRSLIPTPPMRRVANGGPNSVSKVGRQLSLDGKRRTGSRK